IIGLIMAAVFRRSEEVRAARFVTSASTSSGGRPLRQQAVFLSTLVFLLVFSTWGHGVGLWEKIFEAKWYLTALGAVLLAVQLKYFLNVRITYLFMVGVVVAMAAMAAPVPEIPYTIGIFGLSLVLFHTGGEARQWFESSYILARQILPILFIGVIMAGFFLGRPGGEEGMVSSKYVSGLVGGNAISSNLLASFMGVLMYFATLTEVPVLQGFMDAGMGKGPALSLLLAGPAVSLPSILVIRSVMGAKRTLAYILLVVICATMTGTMFGILINS
ncbi:MAG TPA: hypothetical protein G4O05_06950, partial [Caldilineae bacterium]|nr:hypothetical protein [Caldilineae bacterium]